MEKDYKNFVLTLYSLINDLNRYYKTDGTTELLKVFEKLEMPKVIVKVNTTLSQYSKHINDKDSTMFKQSLLLLPDLDMSKYWEKLTSGQKNKIWTYLKILYLESDILINHKPNIEANTNTSQDTFDPFVGVGTNEEYNVEDVMKARELADTEVSSPGIESMISLLGLDKMIDMSALSEQLKNIKKEDIEGITDNLKNYLGEKGGDKASQLVSDIITNISEELSNNINNNNDTKPISNIFNIAKNVAGKMKSKVNQQDVNMQDIINTSQNLVEQCKDDSGAPIFKNNVNPFSMLSQLSNKNMTQKEYMDQCNNMLQQMGMDNPDINKLMEQAQKQTRKKSRYANRRR